jgi:DNA-directed RNA polymerase specialized sigma24 family protein
MAEVTDMTELLEPAISGDRQAQAELYRRTEPELRKLARHWIRRKFAKERVRTTEVIDLAFEKLMGISSPGWQHRGAFYVFASRNILWVLIGLLRIGRRQPASLPDGLPEEPGGLTQHGLLALQQALEHLGKDVSEDHRAVVELRFMGEHTLDEIALILSITRDKAFHMSKFALTYLRKRLGPSFPDFGHFPNQATGD